MKTIKMLKQTNDFEPKPSTIKTEQDPYESSLDENDKNVLSIQSMHESEIWQRI